MTKNKKSGAVHRIMMSFLFLPFHKYTPAFIELPGKPAAWAAFRNILYNLADKNPVPEIQEGPGTITDPLLQ
jgi:hypothetical protein